MKTNKFKIWDKKLNVMWEPIELPTLLRYLIFQNCPNAIAYGALKDHFHDMVWLEFTGLKDRNGNEIYEGDIIKNKDGIGQLYYHVYRASFEILFTKLFRETFSPESRLFESEVIGNIFQNPELLKEQNENK